MPGGGAGAIDSAFSFSSALPEGSRLIVFDFDFQLETMILAQGGNPLTLVEQLERVAGESSVFPTYNSMTGALVEAGLDNKNEASVFDISGLSSIDVTFSGGGLGSGVSLAVFVPHRSAAPSLAPAGMALTFGLVAMACHRKLQGRSAKGAA